MTANLPPDPDKLVDVSRVIRELDLATIVDLCEKYAIATRILQEALQILASEDLDVLIDLADRGLTPRQDSDVVTVADMTRKFGVNRQTVYRWMKRRREDLERR